MTDDTERMIQSGDCHRFAASYARLQGHKAVGDRLDRRADRLFAEAAALSDR